MWLYESTLYQIYPFGFCGAAQTNDGAQADSHTILKTLDWVPHLHSLGANAVLFNPIFESDAHGYDTRDYTKIDRRLGSNEDFAAVCKALKGAGIRIVLDGVFNHVGRGFWAFQDVLQHRQNSRYANWFHISFEGNSNYNDGLWYEGWEGHFELVKLNLQNPEVADYLIECVKGWMNEFDIDGIRLDVAYCVDPNFMRRLREFTQWMKPDFALIGEVLFGDYNRIVNDEMLHSCTNYECYKGLFSSLNDKNLFEIAHSLHRQFSNEQWSLYRGKHLMTFVDNHDVSRIASILRDKNTLPLAYGILLGMPGVPCIYYGSEWGEPGDKNNQSDWVLRPCFDAPKPNELTTYLTKLLQARQGSKALCYGGYHNVQIANGQLVFLRECDGEQVLVAVNITDGEASFWNDAFRGQFIDLITGEGFAPDGNLTLPAYSVRYLRRNG